jgi:hypothetical protein
MEISFKNMKYLIDEYVEKNIVLQKTDMCDIFTKHGSDKGTTHNYSTFYNHIFFPIKNETINLFEVGLGTNNLDILSNMGASGVPGASLRGWKEYFKNALIYGADIDKDILFNEDRIQTFYTDQLNSEIINNMWNLIELKNITFDVIIDDGLHLYKSNRNFFENSINKLKNNGVYIIEDIYENCQETKLWFNELKNSNKYSYINILKLPHHCNISDNVLGIIVK